MMSCASSERCRLHQLQDQSDHPSIANLQAGGAAIYVQKQRTIHNDSPFLTSTRTDYCTVCIGEYPICYLPVVYSSYTDVRTACELRFIQDTHDTRFTQHTLCGAFDYW